MRRRKFIVTTTGVLGLSSGTGRIGSRPAIGVKFNIDSKLTESQVTNNNIILSLSNIGIKASNISNIDSDIVLKLQVNTDIDSKEFHSIKEYSISLDSANENIQIPSLSIDLSSKSSLNYSKASVGRLRLVINHPDIGTKYTTERFIVPDNIVQDGLVGWWPLHEWSGRVNDLSGNKNYGSSNGIVQEEWGKRGLTSTYFDGSGQYISVNDTDVLDLADEITVSVWARPDGDGDRFGNCINRYSDAYYSGDSYGWGLRYNGDYTSWTFGVVADGSDARVRYDGIDINEWQHLVGTYDGEILKLYKDGELVDSRNLTGSIQTLNNNMTIGAGDPDNDYFGGYLNDLRVYDRAISKTEVNELYNAGIDDNTDNTLHNGTDNGAVSRWKFNDSVDDDWNTSNSSSTNINYNSGIRGKSLDAKNSDEVVVTDNTALDITEEMTISGWVKSETPPNEMSASYPNIWSKPNGGDNGSITLGVLSPDTNRFGVRISTGDSSTNLDTRYTIDTTDWTHVSATYNGKYLALYINGVKVSVDKGDISINTNSYDATIGKSWGGLIEDLRLYNRSLTDKEVYELYRWGSRGQDLRERTTTNKSDIAGWWKLNETSGSTAYDSSNNSNNGMVFGAGPVETGTTSSPVEPSSYKFDGSNDYIQIGDSDFGLMDGEPITLSAWAYVGSGGRIVSLWNESFSILQSGPLSTDHLGTRLYDGSSNNPYFIESDLPYTDEWVHIASVYDGKKAVLYINSTLISSNSSATYTISNTKSQIGSNKVGDYGYFEGRVSDVRLYRRALTPQEVSYIYEQKF